ncbi:hypothetical protein ACU8KH_05825 [Lachancea thermotolerans]
MPNHVKQTKEAASGQNEVDSSNIPDAAKRAAQELREEAQDLREEANKEFEELERNGTIDKYKDNAAGILKNVANRASAAASYVATRVKTVSQRVAYELRNPVVIVNAALGVGLVSTLLKGYTKNQRYLKGKSDSVILSTVVGATAAVALDVYLSGKYYQKFDQKSNKKRL